MKKYISLLALLMLCGLMALSAQVKGHSYYALEGNVADQKVELLLEVENEGRLALGQIIYEYGDRPIRLFGHRNRQDANTIDMEEHLDNGQWTGNLSLHIENGAVKSGEWHSASDDTLYPLTINRVKSFPYNMRRTFFEPATKEDLKGHYISYIRQGKAIRQDRALNICPDGEKCGFFSIELSGSTLMLGDYELTGDDEFMFTTPYAEAGTTIATKIYKDFAEVSVLMPGENEEDLKVEAFYIRETGVMELTQYGFDGLLFVRGRLEDGVPSLIVSRKLLAEVKQTGNTFCEISDELKPGRYPLTNVEKPVIDMYIETIGIDINPILCLILEDHTVQILSLTNFIETTLTDMSNPLPNIEDIQKIYCYDPNSTSDQNEEIESDADMVSSVWAIDSKGQSHEISFSYDSGDYIVNPEKGVTGDGYLGMSRTWDIHIIMKESKNVGASYYGQYWIIKYDLENTEYTIGYRMTTQVSDNEEPKPCDIEGTFKYRHDDDEWMHIHVTPIDGLMFTPKGKTAKYNYMEAVG